MAKILYYLDDFTDETMPCAATLEGWAVWLSTADPDWGLPEAGTEGQVFDGFTLIQLADLDCVFEDGSWRHDPPPPEADQFFLLHGPGLGWEAVTHSGTVAECLENAGEFVPFENQRPNAVGIGGHLVPQEGQRELVACVRDGESIKVRYRRTAEGPVCEVVDAP
jgi:hypothetical protein